MNGCRFAYFVSKYQSQGLCKRSSIEPFHFSVCNDLTSICLARISSLHFSLKFTLFPSDFSFSVRTGKNTIIQ